MDIISRLCSWYERQCVDEWQEEYGISIGTLDNPGWSLKIDLAKTSLQERPFKPIELNRSEQDWIIARRKENFFEAFGGTNNLSEMIEAFLNWASLEQPE